MTEQKTKDKPSQNVYALIASCAAEIAGHGISKDRKNTQQGYSFRGIDDVYNALAPILSKNGLVILPFVKSREQVERQTSKGGVLFYTTVEVEFAFVSSFDQTTHVVKTYGEAMDSGDKSTNKAMSAAYKYACMQAFCIPTEGDNDADSTTHEVAPKVEQKAEVKQVTGPEFLDIQKAIKGATAETFAEEKNKARAAYPRMMEAHQKAITKAIKDKEDALKKAELDADQIPQDWDANGNPIMAG